jgi:ABC-2 type transport system permease protein
MLNLLLYELRSRRTAVIGWGLGLAIFAVYVIVLYPDLAPSMAAFNLEDIPAYQALGDITEIATFVGFVSVEVMLWLPIVLAIYAIVNATGTLAGEEDNGTLELTMSLPIRRWQIVLTKALALGVTLLLILLVVGLAAAATFSYMGDKLVDPGIEAADLALGVLGTWPVVMFFAMLALFLGAYLPSRRMAAMTTTVILIASYFANNLAAFSDFLDRLRPIYPFNYYDGRALLTEGPWTADNFLLLGLAALFLVLAVVSFQRRDVTVGAWPWQRGRVPA